VSDLSPDADPGREADPDRIETPQEFGRELTLVRHRADLTVRQVAKAAGLPVSTAGDYFSGRHLPAPGQAESLVKILAACGETDPGRLGSWTAALGRARRPPGKRASGSARKHMASGDAPYRGLASFGPQDAPWFFGREDVTERLVELATGWGIGAGTGLPLIVVGPSGSGKSSLLAAGLMPRLPGPATLIVPTATPAADLGGQLPAEVGYLIVDQFESVFTRCQDEDQRREFITAICDLADKGTVILALRADFYDQALRYPGLADALQSRQVVLGPMTADQVRQAIVEPARRAGLEVEDGLAELLLRDLAPKTAGAQGAHEPGALPLLSHALLSTWELSSTGTITVADYRASGGISDAITRTAEGVFTGLSADEQEMARRLFLRLVHVADDAPPTRSVVRLAELDSWSASAVGLLGRFVDERLITVDADSAQIAHDALLTAWPRLRSWIDAGLDDLRTRRRIIEAARIWEESGRDGSALPRGAQLAIARDWAADEGNRASLSPLASEFVGAAVTQEQARERAERNRTRRLKRLVAALTVLAVAVAGLAGYSYQQRMKAASARNDADSREVAVEAGQVRGQNAPLAAQLSLAAYGIARTPEALASVLESSGTPSAARLTDSPAVVESVSLNRGRGLLAVGAADGSLRLWNVTRPGHPRPAGRPLSHGASSLYTTAISPSGTLLAAAGADRRVWLWNIADPDRPVPAGQPLTGPAGTVYSVAFSPDGHLLAAGSADHTVRLWNVTSPLAPVLLATLHGPAGYVESVAFSPSGHLLAAGSADKTVRLWSVSDPARPAPVGKPLTGPADVVMSVAFGPSGQVLAAGSRDDKVWLWNVASPRHPAAQRSLSGPADWVNAVAFSPSGDMVAAGTSDNRVFVWNLATRSLTAQLPHEDPVTSLAWDGPARLAAGDADGTVSVWSLPSPVLMAGTPVNSVAFSPAGSLLAVGSQTLELWNPVTRTPVATAETPGGTFVNAVAFAPSGAMLAAGYGNGMVQLRSPSAAALGPPVRGSAAGPVESVAFSPSGQVMATGGDDGTVRLWSVSGSAVRPLAVMHDSGTYVYSVAFSPSGRMLAAASADDRTRLWSVADPSRPVPEGAPLTGPTSYAISVAFSPDGKTLAAGVTDGTVWLWKLAAGGHPALMATLNGPNGHVYSVAFSPSGRVVAAGSADGTVRLWDTSPAAAVAAVCAGAGQPLTRLEWANYVPGLAYRAPCS
jgi:WD40 repeat protein/transcriptional regulator with XRE-family HTH domain